MSDPTATIIAILKPYMRDPGAAIAPDTTLSELEIDRLDLPMIFLDIEDALGVQCHNDDDICDCDTVACLTDRVIACIAAKAARPRQPKVRPKSNWMSTGAERRR
jgi:acyl carrier protein